MFRKLLCILYFTGLLGFLAPLQTFSQELTDLRKLVDDARLTFENFVGNPGHSWLQNNVKFAKGIFIMPSLGEAGYLVGGSLGNAVLLLHDQETGEWSEPAFYRLVGGTFGLQIGASQSEVLGLVMTQRGVESLLQSTVLLGAGATVAVGPVGGGISGGVSPRVATDFLTFASSKGAMVNLSLGGTVVAVRGDAHEVYYGERISPEDILIERKVSNWYSDRIRKAVTEAAGGVWSSE